MYASKTSLLAASVCSVLLCGATATGQQSTTTPSVEHLVRYLNSNADRVEGLRAQVTLDVNADGQKVGVSGNLACKGSQCVRLRGMVLGNPAFDLGSNAEQYWFWNREAKPHPFLLMRRSKAPSATVGPMYRPEWLLDVLGIRRIDAEKKISVACDNKHLELSEEVLSPQGKALRKVIVFHRHNRSEGQIAAVLLKDAEDRILCRAEIKKTYHDEKSGAFVAQDILLTFPPQKIEVRMVLHDIKIGPIPREQADRLFTSKSVPEGRSGEEAEKPTEATDRIAIDLAQKELTARCGEETLRLVGQPTTNLALLLLRSQLHSWMEDRKAATVRITCPGSLEFVTVHAVFRTCREAGLRKIEMRVSELSREK